jgi:hypothetical protein
MIEQYFSKTGMPISLLDEYCIDKDQLNNI